MAFLSSRTSLKLELKPGDRERPPAMVLYGQQAEVQKAMGMLREFIRVEQGVAAHSNNSNRMTNSRMDRRLLSSRRSPPISRL